jgi:hypothetical protein
MKGGTLVVIFLYLSTGVIDPKILGVGVWVLSCMFCCEFIVELCLFCVALYFQGSFPFSS